jgi:hypothetical protein
MLDSIICSRPQWEAKNLKSKQRRFLGSACGPPEPNFILQVSLAHLP